jgi:hypothetical protein
VGHFGGLGPGCGLGAPTYFGQTAWAILAIFFSIFPAIIFLIPGIRKKS